jgi:hypothetical protein
MSAIDANEALERSQLEQLDRDTLIARAQASGVSRARILTRPELIDELLLRTTSTDDLPRVRGLFGRARDLLARVIERGLHLPDAAERLRTKMQAPPVTLRSAAAPLPTLTLAEIYAAQGHRERAIGTLRTLLLDEPEHAAARALLAQLEDAAYKGPKARLLPPEDEEPPRPADAEEELPPVQTAAPPAGKPEPMGMLDDAPLPPKYDVDECVALPVDPTTMFAYWEVRDRTREHLEGSRAGGRFVLRVLVVSPGWDGPRSSLRDIDVSGPLGDAFVRDLPKGAVVRAAIGWSVGDEFIAVAHSPALETPPGEPSPILAEALVRWTPRGAIPLGASDRDASSIERALGLARTRAGRERFGGSSELWVQAR